MHVCGACSRMLTVEVERAFNTLDTGSAYVHTEGLTFFRQPEMDRSFLAVCTFAQGHRSLAARYV